MEGGLRMRCSWGRLGVNTIDLGRGEMVREQGMSFASGIKPLKEIGRPELH